MLVESSALTVNENESPAVAPEGTEITRWVAVSATAAVVRDERDRADASHGEHDRHNSQRHDCHPAAKGIEGCARRSHDDDEFSL